MKTVEQISIDLDLSNALIPPARADRLSLIMNQANIWIDFHGKIRVVNFMPLDYVHNLRKFLHRRAFGLKVHYELREIMFLGSHSYGEAASDAIDDAMIELFDTPHKQWIREQPLYRRLVMREWRLRNK